MKKNTIKNTVLVVLFIILAPLILVGVTALGNSLGGKTKDKVVQTTEQTAKVPEETKAENNKDYRNWLESPTFIDIIENYTETHSDATINSLINAVLHYWDHDDFLD